MKDIYLDIWNLAKQYYIKGRPMDIDHIEWMMGDAILICEKEKLDDTILLPLVILHDVGYSEVPKDNPFNLDIRKAHMDKGCIISKRILSELKYDMKKIEIISNYVAVHDNWSFGDNNIYKDKILGTFNDLDYIWMATPKGFVALMGILKKNKKEMLEFLETNEKLINRPFLTKTASDLYEDYIRGRTMELNN